jgi:hypothetical protein
MYVHCKHRDDFLCAVVVISVCIFEQLSVFTGVVWIQLAENIIWCRIFVTRYSAVNSVNV